MARIILTGKVEPEIEDGGMAMIANIDPTDDSEGFFVRLQSWDETKKHPTMKQFVGRQVRVTVELI